MELLLTPWGLGLLGLVVGSFLNVVAHRLPLMLERQWWGDVAGQLADTASFQRVFGNTTPAALVEAGSDMDSRLQALPALGLARPASRCPACGHRIRWYENIPLVSWLALRGRCSACKTAISPRYPLIELLTGLLFAGVAWRMGAQPVALLWCGVVAVLVALAAIDWDTTVLPDALTLPLLWAGLLAAALGWTLPLDAAVVGAVVGYLSLWSVYWLFKLATGKEGMGYGDFKLLAALGAWLSWQAILPIVLFASVLGAAIGLVMKATGGLREGRYVPFGPFLVGGGLGVMLLGLPRVLGFMGWGVTSGVRSIGLTGGIGSGKSTVAAQWVAHGAHLVDTDAISRALTAPGGAALPVLAQVFGPGIVGADGALDRTRMRQLAFGNPAARQRLEAVLHPLIGAEADVQAGRAAGRVVVYDVPLLAESSRWRQRVDRVLVVDCPEALQVQRVMQRSGWDTDAVRRVIAQQAPRASRRAIADALIHNGEATTLADLARHVAALCVAWGIAPASGAGAVEQSAT